MRVRTAAVVMGAVILAGLTGCGAGNDAVSAVATTSSSPTSSSSPPKSTATSTSRSSSKAVTTTPRPSTSSNSGVSASDVQVFQFGIDKYGDGKSTISTQEIAELGQTYCVLYSPSKGGDNSSQFAYGAALMIKAGVSPADTAVASQVAVELYCPQEKPYFDQMKAVLAPG